MGHYDNHAFNPLHYQLVRNILAIIPARGGSKRIPKKNIKKLAGKPLICYSIESAIGSSHINRIVVSTDDESIARISKRQGVEVIMRPEHLAQDKTLIVPVLQHAVKVLEGQGYFPEFVVLLQPTSPLRSSKEIDYAINKLISEGGDSAETFCEVKEHPASMFRIVTGVAVPFDRANLRKRSQDLPLLFRETGAVYVVKRDLLMKKGSLYGKRHIPVIVSRERSVDIDEEIDFSIAELIMKKGKGRM
jgi:CMP-N-acetylneuraminic acid synthetase